MLGCTAVLYSDVQWLMRVGDIMCGDEVAHFVPYKHTRNTPTQKDEDNNEEGRRTWSGRSPENLFDAHSSTWSRAFWFPAPMVSIGNVPVSWLWLTITCVNASRPMRESNVPESELRSSCSSGVWVRGKGEAAIVKAYG